MQRYSDPFEAMDAVHGILVKRGLSLNEGNWSKEILSYTCDRRYDKDVHYEITILLTENGFNEVKRQLGMVNYTISTYSVQGDSLVRIKLSIEGVLHLLVLVPEDTIDAIMAL